MAAPPAQPAPRPLPFFEFIALLALLFSSVAYSIDAMLPMLAGIGRELSPADPERAQLVVTIFVAGMGIGTFLAGPVSDSLGRKPVILGGIALYMAAATLAAQAESLEALLIARFLQGLGVSGPRVVAQALVRDLYSGRVMAQVMSFAMTLFVLVPAVAPMIGAWIGGAFGWRAIFWSFVVFGLIAGLWLGLRQPETLPPARRRPLAARRLWAALSEVLGHARVRLYLAAQSFAFATMFIWISSIALVFDQAYGRAAEFPYWFAAVALLSAPASLLNARLVIRLGMHRLVMAALATQIAAAAAMLAGLGFGLGAAEFPAFVTFMVVQFFTIGLVFGNLNALALEPMGHVAGMAASVMGGVSTLASALIATVLVWLLDGGSAAPLAISALLCALAAVACMIRARRLA